MRSARFRSKNKARKGAVAVMVYYLVGTITLMLYLRSQRSVVHLSAGVLTLRWALFRDILRVGIVAALVTITTNLTIAITTGLVGRLDQPRSPATAPGRASSISWCRSCSASAVLSSP